MGGKLEPDKAERENAGKERESEEEEGGGGRGEENGERVGESTRKRREGICRMG